MNACSVGKCMFYDAVNMIHASLEQLIHFHILLNLCLSELEIMKLNISDIER